MREKLRVYLAGSSRELSRVSPMVQALDQSEVITITCRWWEAVQLHGVGHDALLTREQQARLAMSDLAGIREADLFWCLMPKVRSNALLELGYAISRQKSMLKPTHVVCTGPSVEASIFTAIWSIDRHEDDIRGLEYVLKEARGRS